MENLTRLDALLLKMVKLAEIQIETALDRNAFSKDTAEGCGIVLSLAYARWPKGDAPDNDRD